MLDLNFTIAGVEPVRHAAVPQLAFRLRIEERRLPGDVAAAASDIQSILLRCQVRIEPTGRTYSGEDPRKLFDLFGEPKSWGRSMRSLLWTNAQTLVGPFCGATEAELPVPCTFDFNVAATKYFAALETGEVPLSLLFSGTVFYRMGLGLQVSPISWDKEARYRLPVSVWRQMMDQYYPNAVWLALDRGVFDRLAAYQSRRGLPNWQRAIDELLAHENEHVPL